MAPIEAHACLCTCAVRFPFARVPTEHGIQVQDTAIASFLCRCVPDVPYECVPVGPHRSRLKCAMRYLIFHLAGQDFCQPCDHGRLARCCFARRLLPSTASARRPSSAICAAPSRNASRVQKKFLGHVHVFLYPIRHMAGARRACRHVLLRADRFPSPEEMEEHGFAAPFTHKATHIARSSCGHAFACVSDVFWLKEMIVLSLRMSKLAFVTPARAHACFALRLLRP